LRRTIHLSNELLSEMQRDKDRFRENIIVKRYSDYEQNMSLSVKTVVDEANKLTSVFRSMQVILDSRRSTLTEVVGVDNAITACLSDSIITCREPVLDFYSELWRYLFSLWHDLGNLDLSTLHPVRSSSKDEITELNLFSSFLANFRNHLLATGLVNVTVLD